MQLVRTFPPVDAFYNDVGIDPAEFLMDDVKLKHGAIMLGYQNCGVSDWSDGWVGGF